MLHYPEGYYHESETLASSYRETPPGQLEPLRMLDALPAWKTSSVEAAKRTLVLNDWAIHSWSDKYLAEVQNKLERAREDGFSIYYYDNGELLPLTKSNQLADLRHGKPKYIPTKKQLVSAAAQRGTEADKLLILDNYQVKELVNGFQKSPHCLYIDEFFNGQYTYAEIVEHIKQCKPPLSKIIINQHHPQLISIYRYLRHQFPSVDLELNLTKLTLSFREINTLVRGGSIEITPGIRITLDSLRNVQAFWFAERSFFGIYDEQWYLIFNEFLKAMPDVRALDLNQCYLGDDNIRLDWPKQLEHVAVGEGVFVRIIAVTLEKICNEKYGHNEIEVLTEGEIEDAINTIFQRTEANNKVSIDCFGLYGLNSLFDKNFKRIAFSNNGLKPDYLYRGFSGAEHYKLGELGRLLKESWRDRVTLALSQKEVAEFLKEANSLDNNLVTKITHLRITGDRDARLIDSIFTKLGSLFSLELINCFSFNPSSMNRVEALHLFYDSLDLNSWQKVAPDVEESGCSKLSIVIKKLPKNPETGEYDLSLFEKIPLSENVVSLALPFPVNIQQLNRILPQLPNLQDLTLRSEAYGLDYITIQEPLNFDHNLQMSSLGLSRINILVSIADEFRKKYPHLTISAFGPQFVDEAPVLNYKNAPSSQARALRQLSRSSSSEGEAQSSEHPGQSSPSEFTGHDRNRHRSHKSKSPQEQVRYLGQPTSRDQGAIMSQFGRYLAKSGRELEPSLQFNDGICAVLASWFYEDPEDFEAHISHILKWDGQEDTLAECKTSFALLHSEILEHEFNTHPRKVHYLGENIKKFLELQKQKKTTRFILTNTWHAIAVEYKDNNWCVYEPNHPEGTQSFASLDEAVALIYKSLGPLVCYQSSNQNLEISVALTNPDKFLAEGGLLILVSCENYQHLLHKLQRRRNFSKVALDGLLLRDTQGVPAWILGLENEATLAFTRKLLAQLKIMYPENYSAMLQHSMSGMTDAQKQKYSEVLPCFEDKRMQIAARQIKYDTAFSTWTPTAQEAVDVYAFCTELLESERAKQRVDLRSDAAIQGLQCALHKAAKQNGRPIIYIHSPQELRCKGGFIEKEGDHYVIRRGAGGRFKQFLEDNEDKNPIVVINFSRFSKADFGRYNSLLDSNPEVDGVPLPAGTQVIGLMNPTAIDAYEGSDFTSRIGKAIPNPVPEARLVAEVARPVIAEQSDEMPAVIQLFNASDWRALLIGHFTLNGQTLSYQEGPLLQALKAKKTCLELVNAPWDDSEFQHFWQQASLLGYIEVNGEKFDLPKGFTLMRREGFDWKTLAESIDIDESTMSTGKRWILNPYTFNQFNVNYQCEEDLSLTTRNGIVEQHVKEHPDEPLAIYVTRQLSDDLWARLLSQCEKHKVRLAIKLAPGVKLPKELTNVSPALESLQTELLSPEPLSEKVDSASSVIVTENPRETIKRLKQSDSTAQVVHVTGCELNEFITSLHGRLNQETQKFEFENIPGLLDNLAEDIPLIFTGEFSNELIDGLTQYVLETNPTRKITFVTQQTDAFPALARYQDTDVSPEPAPEVQSFDLSVPDMAEYSLADSEARAQAFMQARVDSIIAALNESSIVSLLGLTGVGKTTTVSQDLKRDGRVDVFMGEDALVRWAQARGDKPLVLFPDEINFHRLNPNMFSGLLDTPPSIVIDNKLHVLTENHKVMGALNPESYGNGRKSVALFEKQGKTVVFDPLSPEVIYEKVLKPIFQEAGLPPEKWQSIAEPILDVYVYLCQCSDTEVLITPRELETMAMLAMTKLAQSDDSSFAAFYAFEVAKALVPDKHRAEFLGKFSQPSRGKSQRCYVDSQSKLIITPSRAQLIGQLESFLNLQQIQKQRGNFRGLGGMVIEGEPGIGKSEYLKAVLKKQGYVEIKDIDKPPKSMPERAFIVLSATMSPQEVERHFDFATQHGILIIGDEINTLPLPEDHLNAWLMGNQPTGKPKPAPGFKVIGTQNSIQMPGRRPLSPALARRLVRVEVPPYNEQELLEIARLKRVPTDAIEQLVTTYLDKTSEAHTRGYESGPTFREFSKLAEEEAAKGAQSVSSAVLSALFGRTSAASSPSARVHSSGHTRRPT